MRLLSGNQFRDFGILILILFQSFLVKAQSTIENGVELTNKYASEMDVDVSKPMKLNGKDAWVFSIPQDFTFGYLKEKTDVVSKRLGVDVLSDWEEDEDVFIYGFVHEDHNFALAYMPGKRMLISMIEPVKLNSQLQKDEDWKTIKTFSGSGTKNTSSFSVSSPEWRVIYESKATMSGLNGSGHIFQLYLLRPGQKMYEGEIVANVANKKSIEGKSSFYETGKFYFKSNSANGDWNIKVQIQE